MGSNLVSITIQYYIWMTVYTNLQFALSKMDDRISDALVEKRPKLYIDGMYSERNDLSIAVAQIGDALGLSTVGGKRP